MEFMIGIFVMIAIISVALFSVNAGLEMALDKAKRGDSVKIKGRWYKFHATEAEVQEIK